MWASYSMLLVFGLSVGLPGPAVPSLQDTYGLSYAGAALHLTLFSVGSAVGSALDDRLDRRFHRATLLRASLIAVAIGAALCGLAPTASVSLAGITFMGTGGTIAINIAHGVLGSEHADGRGTVLANAHLFAALGLASAALVVAGARAVGQWRLAFAVPVVVVAVILFTRQPRRLPTHTADPAAPSAPRTPTSTAVRIGGIVLALSVAVEWAVTFWAASFLRDPVGLTPAFADAITVGVLAALVLGRWLLGRLTRARAADLLLRAAFVITIATSVPYLAGPRLPDPFGVIVPVVALLVLCLTVTMLFPLALALTLTAAGGSSAEQQHASATALGMGAAGAVITPYLLGATADATTLTTALVVLPAGALLALLGMAAMHRSTQPAR
jgi:fucose permease